MHRSILACAIVLITLAMLSGCGSSDSGSNSGNVPVILTMRDTPPTGVTVLAFSVTVSGVTLTGSGNGNATLLSSPTTVQLSNLLTQSTILADTSANAGTYSNIMITFANPSVTVLNGSATTFSVGGKSCAPAATCTLTPTLNQVSSTISTNPFPLTLSQNNPINLALDFNVNSSIQSDLSVTPSVTVSSPTSLTNGDLQDFTMNGQVTQTGANQFTVTNASTGTPLSFTTNGTTTFSSFAQNGTNCTTANTMACIAANQNVGVNFGISKTSPSTLTATGVTLQSGITNGIRGTVVATNVGSNQFTMVVTGVSPTQTNVTVGQKLVVTAPILASSFAVQAGTGLTVPGGLTFTSISNLTVGQNVEIDPTAVSSVNGTATADEVLLMPSQFTGTVASVSSPNFTVNGLNGVFTGGSVSTLAVDTQAGTTFPGTATSVSGLTVGQPITIGGTVFSTGTGTTVVGGQVVQ